MKTLKNTFAILFISLLTFSCSNDDNEPTPTPIPSSDVFAAGSDNSTPSQEFFYKNNTKTNLAVASNESANISAMFVDGNDVYITGSVYVYPETGNSYSQACYWKNNVKINLPHYIPASGSNYADTFAITVVNGDIYILGVEQDSFGVSNNLSVWINGVRNSIASTVPTSSIFARSICVYNNDIYVSGAINDGTTSRATFWKNGIATTVSSASSACSDIKVDQTGIHVLYAEYVGGGVASSLKYWKDGVNTTVSTQIPEAGKIAVKGANVYITGAERETGSAIFKACYWKNGVKKLLDGGNGLVADDIKMGANGDLFVSSRTAFGGYTFLTYWQNDVKKTLGTSNDNFRDFDINNK